MGRILNIGVVKSVSGNVFAELVSVLLNERTGTTVNIKVFESSEEIYAAVKKEEIGIVIENTDNAMHMLGMESSNDKKRDYDISKNGFREQMNLIWLRPFGLLHEGDGMKYYSAVISEDVLINFPALPRVINKLDSISGDKQFSTVLREIASGEKVKKTARNFLKKKKLI